MRIIFILILAAIIAMCFCSCYSEKKAQQQFSRAAVTFPKLPADYCAFYFPVKDSIVKDTVNTTDTIFKEGINDTIYSINRDTITIIKTLPAKIITNTIHIRDTIFQEGGKTAAQLRSCELDKSSLISQLKNQTSKTDLAQGKATKRGKIMWGLIAFIALVIGFNIYRKIKPIKV